MYPIFYLIAIRDLIVYRKNRVPALCSYLLYYVPTFIVIEFIPFENTIEGRERQIQEDGYCKAEINKCSASKTCLHNLQMKTQEGCIPTRMGYWSDLYICCRYVIKGTLDKPVWWNTWHRLVTQQHNTGDVVVRPLAASTSEERTTPLGCHWT